MSGDLHPASALATRTITTRRPKFDYGGGLSRRHFAQGDLLTSHLVAVLSGIIPEGERFVVDAVKRYRADIADPLLKQQANAFVGQESVHQREHERLNEVLHITEPAVDARELDAGPGCVRGGRPLLVPAWVPPR